MVKVKGLFLWRVKKYDTRRERNPKVLSSNYPSTWPNILIFFCFPVLQSVCLQQQCKTLSFCLFPKYACYYYGNQSLGPCVLETVAVTVFFCAKLFQLLFFGLLQCKDPKVSNILLFISMRTIFSHKYKYIGNVDSFWNLKSYCLIPGRPPDFEPSESDQASRRSSIPKNAAENKNTGTLVVNAFSYWHIISKLYWNTSCDRTVPYPNISCLALHLVPT